MVELEKDCERCKGTGRIYVVGGTFCPRCVDGKVPTAEGEKVLDFIGRHLIGSLPDKVEYLKQRINDLEDPHKPYH